MVGGHYRGADRRVSDDSAGPVPVLAGSFVATAVAVVTLSGVAAGGMADDVAALLLPALWSASLAMAAVGALASLLYGDATGDARAVRIGSSLVLAAMALVADAATSLDAVAHGLALGAAVWTVSALLGPDVDVRRTIAHELVATSIVVALPVGSVGALASMLQVGVGSWGSAVVSAMWLVAAAVAVLHRGPSPIVAWSPLAALGWAGWSTAGAVGAGWTSWQVAGQAVLALGLSSTALGAALALARAVRLGRRQLHDATLGGRLAQQSLVQRLREERHELRNALLSVEGASLTLARFRGSLGEDVEAELRDAVDQGFARLRRLLEDEPEAGPSRVVDLRGVLRRTHLLWRAAGVDVQIEVAPGVPALLTVDLDTLSSVLDNLLRNAQRHAGADLDHPVRVGVHLEGGRLVLVVADGGPGIPADLAGWVFRRGATTRPSEGDGLGLAAARAAARGAGGDLHLEPSEGGACFRLTLQVPGDGALPGLGSGRDELHDRVDVG